MWKRGRRGEHGRIVFVFLEGHDGVRDDGDVERRHEHVDRQAPGVRRPLGDAVSRGVSHVRAALRRHVLSLVHAGAVRRLRAHGVLRMSPRERDLRWCAAHVWGRLEGGVRRRAGGLRRRVLSVRPRLRGGVQARLERTMRGHRVSRGDRRELHEHLRGRAAPVSAVDDRRTGRRLLHGILHSRFDLSALTVPPSSGRAGAGGTHRKRERAWRGSANFGPPTEGRDHGVDCL